LEDPRYKWFVENYGDECWELDAMDPNDLRDCVEDAIRSHLDQDAWDRYVTTNEAEQASLRLFFDSWQGK
jgi:hypothetical protein